MPSLALHAPENLAESVDLLARYGDDARPIAGGTALVLLLRQGLIAPTVLVRLDRVPGLNAISRENGLLRLGAMASLRSVSDSPEVRAAVPVLAEACGLVGNIRVRNAATIGGNVCEADYASDPPGVLTALDARVVAVSPRGSREIPVADFITDFLETRLDPDELVTEVIVPVPEPGTHAVYLKYLTRSSEDRPCVGATAVIRTDKAGRVTNLRVAVGAIAGRPLRLPDVERQALGQPLTDTLARELADAYAAAADPISDVRGSSGYRKRMVAVFVRRALQEAATGYDGARSC